MFIDSNSKDFMYYKKSLNGLHYINPVQRKILYEQGIPKVKKRQVRNSKRK